MKIPYFLSGALQRHRKALLICLILSVISGFLSPLLSVLLAQAFSNALGYSSLRGAMLDDLFGGMASSILFLCAVLALRWGFDWAGLYQRGLVLERWLAELRERLFEQQLRIDTQVYEQKGSGRYLLRFSGDLGALQNLAARGVLQFASDAVVLGVGLTYICWAAPQIGGVMVLALAVSAVVLRIFTRQVGFWETRRRDGKSALLAFVANRLQHIGAVRSLNRESSEQKLFDKRTEAIRELGGPLHFWTGLTEASAAVLVYILLLLAIPVLAGLRQQTIDPTSLLAVAFIVLSWRGLIGRMLRVGLIWEKGAISVRKMGDFFDLPTAPGIDLPDQPKLRGALRAENLNARLGDTPLWSGLNFELKRGTIGLIHAPAGGGKSALVKILAGITSPDSGDLYIGDQRLSECHPKSARRRMTFVSDKFPLYGRTLGDAIAYSRSSDDRLMAAIQLQQWQQRFPALEGLSPDTGLKDPLARLSFAQMRLLQYLRAMLADKAIWVIDEPLLGLDETSATELMKIFETLRAKKAILLLSTNEVFPINIDWKVDLSK